MVSLNGRKLDVLACRVIGPEFARIGRYLQRQGTSLSDCMREGMVLEVQGKIELGEHGTIFLNVTKIAENFTLSGALHDQDRHTLDALRLWGVPASRISAPDIHCSSERRPEFPSQLKRLLVITPEESHGLADFKSRVRRAEQTGALTIDYMAFRWSSGAAPEMFQAKLAETAAKGYDLILVIRGGGHWSKLRVFEHPEVALAIHRCPIPIATAIGHEPDTSMADRAASFSFVTPTAAGEAVKRELDRRRFSDPKHNNQRTWAPKSSPAQATAKASRMPTASLAELNRIKAQSAAFRMEAQASQNAHIRDLLELAQRRVRLISRLRYFAFLAAGIMALLVQQGALEAMGLGSSLLAHILYPIAAIGIPLSAAWLEKRRRKSVSTPATKTMKNAPRDPEEWRGMAKGVRTIRGSRQLLANMPYAR
ncbi:exodeoxyribonuclease VII large subunit [bacterium RCC_150]